jgi:hypothetical protein
MNEMRSSGVRQRVAPHGTRLPAISIPPTVEWPGNSMVNEFDAGFARPPISTTTAAGV